MRLTTHTFYAAATSTLALAASTPKQFHVGFSVGELKDGVPNLAAPRLMSADGQPAGEFVFAARALAEGPGLPASLLGTSKYKDLVFDTTSVFGNGSVTAVAKPVGITAGAMQPVVAYENGKSDPSWIIYGKDRIIHSRSSAFESFFLCKQTIDGEELSVLSYGNPKADGKAPEGCDYTTLYVN